MKKTLTHLLPVLLFLMLSACGTLAPSGPYTDKALYDADLAITTGYNVLHEFVTWERDNRAALTAYPDVTHAADNVRANARKWIGSAIAMRETYANQPTKDNRVHLTSVIAVLRTATTEATKFLIKTPVSAPIVPDHL